MTLGPLLDKRLTDVLETAPQLRSYSITAELMWLGAEHCCVQGIARQRQAIVNGLRESVLNFERESHSVLARMRASCVIGSPLCPALPCPRACSDK